MARASYAVSDEALKKWLRFPPGVIISHAVWDSDRSLVRLFLIGDIAGGATGDWEIAPAIDSLQSFQMKP